MSRQITKLMGTINRTVQLLEAESDLLPHSWVLADAFTLQLPETCRIQGRLRALSSFQTWKASHTATSLFIHPIIWPLSIAPQRLQLSAQEARYTVPDLLPGQTLAYANFNWSFEEKAPPHDGHLELFRATENDWFTSHINLSRGIDGR